MKTQIFLLLQKTINSKLLTSSVLIISLGASSVVLAEYKPPADQRPPSTYTIASGSRGRCTSNKGLSLTPLAPQKYVGKTVSQYPTFAWFVPESKPLPLEFALFEYGQNNSINPLLKIKLNSSPGIMSFSLPKRQLGLTVSKRYLWQVALLCDPDNSSQDLVVRADMEVVEIPATLKNAVSNTRDRTQLANLYASSGFWYDAFAQTLTPTRDAQLKQLAASLLTDLAKFEESEHSESLQQITSHW